MKSKIRSRSETAKLAPVSAETLVKNIKRLLDVPYETLALWAGPSYTTLGYWAGGVHAHQVEALLRLLARLPAPDRHRVIDEACPVYPSLAHPFIARDRTLESRLSRLLRQSSGVTLVQGESEYLRTWMLTALGHSFERIKSRQGRLAGLDLSRSDWWVPVSGVTYLPPTALVAPRLDPAFFQGIDLFLCNGAYQRWPGLRSEIQKASATCHVVLAEANLSQGELARSNPPRHVIRVGVDGRYSQREDDAAYMVVRVEELAG